MLSEVGFFLNYSFKKKRNLIIQAIKIVFASLNVIFLK